MFSIINFILALEAVESLNLNCIIGSHDEIISMVTEKLGIPYLITSLYGGEGTNVSFFMLPKPAEIVAPVTGIMRRYNWGTTGVIYEEALGESLY